MNYPTQLRPGRIYRKEAPVRDEKYLVYVRQFPCAGCKTTRRRRDAMHIGPHGIGQKASDTQAAPGCVPCHRELHKIGREAFELKRNVSLNDLMRLIRRCFRLKFPDHVPAIRSAVDLYVCPCGFEDCEEEFEISGCPMCGRPWEGRAA